jgi:hypothetical protein
VAEYGLLQDLGLVPLGDCRNVHSVLIQPSVDFTIYLPPSKIGQTGATGNIGNTVPANMRMHLTEPRQPW